MSSPPLHQQNPPHQQNIPTDPQGVWNRQRAASNVPAFPYGASPYLHGPTLFNPFGPHQFPPLPPPGLPHPPIIESAPRSQLPLHPELPFIIDPSSFQIAVNHDPKIIYDTMQALQRERDELKVGINRLKVENDRLKATRNGLEVQNKKLEAENKTLVIKAEEAGKMCGFFQHDYRSVLKMNAIMAQIVDNQTGKQVVLWKYIWRLKNGETSGPYVDENGFWRPMSQAPMAPVSEASEPSSDHSDVSTAGSKDSSETKLDPHAQSFVPQSPIKPVLEQESLTPYTPTKSSVTPKHATVEDAEDNETTPTNETTTFIDPAHEPVEELWEFREVIVTLPANFFGVCPNSLSMPGPCPLIHCRLQALCADFNDENGPGCQNRACGYAHIYRSCTEELDGVGCSYLGIPETSPKRIAHFTKRVHFDGPSGVSRKEWAMRVAISELREAHKAKRY